MAEIGEGMKKRKSAFNERRKLQAAKLRLPAFPTTTIGSFPQTDDVRKARSKYAKGELSYVDYDAFLKKETAATIRWQEEIGLDVLVHGEFERNDMVQYFGEQLSVSPSRSMPGCKATTLAAYARLSSSATSRGPIP